MRIQGNGVGEAVHEITERGRALVRLEMELAALELRGKVAALGAGVALAVSGALFAIFALGFLLTAGALALATAMPSWLAVLIVGLVLAAAAAAMVGIGVTLLRRGL